LRLKLKDAYAKMGDIKTWERLSAKLDKEYKSYESWLRSTPDGYQALREARDSKIWNISLSGICPGTSCDDGLPQDFARPCGTDVPGSRCSLCRFFVSGPPFLPGLVQEFNCVLFHLEQKAHRQKQLRDEIEEAGDKNRYGHLEILRGEMEKLENECHLDLKVLAQLHILINDCISMLNNQAKSPEDNTLALVCTQPEELRAKVNYVGHFTRLKELVDAAESLPTSMQTAPDRDAPRPKIPAHPSARIEGRLHLGLVLRQCHAGKRRGRRERGLGIDDLRGFLIRLFERLAHICFSFRLENGTVGAAGCCLHPKPKSPPGSGPPDFPALQGAAKMRLCPAIVNGSKTIAVCLIFNCSKANDAPSAAKGTFQPTLAPFASAPEDSAGARAAFADGRAS
jgi:hypothetical protein